MTEGEEEKEKNVAGGGKGGDVTEGEEEKEKNVAGGGKGGDVTTEVTRRRRRRKMCQELVKVALLNLQLMLMSRRLNQW